MSSLDKYKHIKVLIAIPSLNREWHEKFCMSLVQLMSFWQMEPLGKYKGEEVRVCSVRGSILPNVRLDLVKQAQKIKASHILFIDTDQTFPKETLHALFEANKDIVACNIATKTIPAAPTARYHNPDDLMHGRLVYNEPNRGIEKVWRVGCGVMLIKMKVFDTIGLNVWGMPWNEAAQKYQGEDWSFVEAAEKAGFETYVHHPLSELVKHIGDYAFDHNVVGEMMTEEVAQPAVKLEVARG